MSNNTQKPEVGSIIQTTVKLLKIIQITDKYIYAVDTNDVDILVVYTLNFDLLCIGDKQVRDINLDEYEFTLMRSESPTSKPSTNPVPSHYQLGETGLDANDIAAIIMKDMPANVSRLEASYWHQAFCYVLRMYRKESVENDAKKAISYLQKIIEMTKNS